MKNRKQKQSPSKKILINAYESANISNTKSSSKHVSGHIKTSTSCTINSLIVGSNNKTANKQTKKSINLSSKQCNSQSDHKNLTLKNSKRFKKMQLALNNLNNNKYESCESYRQYCLIDQNFVPICKGDDQKIINQFLAKTATSTCDFNDFTNIEKPSLKPIRNKLHRISNSNLNQISNQKTKTLKQDKATSSLKKDIYSKTAQVQAVADCAQIGIQYSERKSAGEDSIEKNTSINTQTEPLCTLLQKLQRSHFNDTDNSYKVLSSNEKTHYSQLLQTIASKLKPSSKLLNNIQPISFDVIIEGAITQNEQSQTFKECQKQCHKLSVRPDTINYEHLSDLINLRECRQMNQIEDSIVYDNELAVNTSLLAVINFLCHLFCFIEVEYSQHFVQMIRRRYGLTFRQKYRRISKNTTLVANQQCKVVDDTIFLDFINQSNCQYNTNQMIHLRAIFDAFNEHLEQYRPFYSCNGQQFPWSFKMFTTMSEYSIDQDSLQIIFRQSKDKMIQWASSLCGLIVQHQQKVMLPKNPLQIKLAEKQDLLIASWISSQNFEKDSLQIFCTKALHQASQRIYQDLIQEFVKQSMGKFI